MNIPDTCDFPDCDCPGPERCEKGKKKVCWNCQGTSRLHDLSGVGYCHICDGMGYVNSK